MKRLLSFLLAACMLIGMLPSVSARNDDAVTATVTYDFSHSALKGAILEKVSLDGTVTKNLTSFSDISVKTNGNVDNWAYLGTNIDFAVATANGATAGGFVLGTGGYSIAAIGSSGYVHVYAPKNNYWIAFQIKVPETATYKLSAITAEKANMNDIEFYIVPKEAFDAKVNYGTPTVTEGTFSKVGATSFNDLEISSNIMASAACTNTGSITLTDLNEQELSANTEYVLVIRNGYTSGKHVRVKSLTLSYETYPLDRIEAEFSDIFTGKAVPAPSVKWYDINGETDGKAGNVSFDIEDDGDGVLVKSGDKIFAAKEGEAKIKVTGTLNNVTKTQIITVTAQEDDTWAGENVDYVFNTSNGEGNYAIPGVKNVSMTETDFNRLICRDYSETRPWAMVSGNVTCTNDVNGFFATGDTHMHISDIAGEWLALKVKIPAPGRYRVDLAASGYVSSGLVSLYMLPYEQGMNFASVRQNISTYTKNENYVGAMDTCLPDVPKVNLPESAVSAVGIGDFYVEPSAAFEEKGFEEYLVVFKTGASPVGGKVPIRLRKLSFVGEAALDKVNVLFDNTEIAAGETASITGVVGKTSSDVVIDTSDAYVIHSLKTGSEDVLEMSDDGTSFNAKRDGEAAVITTVMLDGAVRTQETVIKVDDSYKATDAYIYPKTNYAVGDEVTFDVRVERADREIYNDGTVVSYEITENPDNALSLSDDGKILTAEAVGAAKVRAKVSAHGKIFDSDTVTVTVVSADVSGEAVASAALVVESSAIGIDDVIVPEIKLYDADGTELEYDPAGIKRVIWTSDNETVAKAFSTGEILGVADGIAKINVAITYGNKNLSASIELAVEDRSGIDLSKGIYVSAPESVYIYGMRNVSVSVTMNSGNVVRIPNDYVTWNLQDEAMTEIADLSVNDVHGNKMDYGVSVYGRSLGKAVICPVVDPAWREIGEVTVAPVTVEIVWDTAIDPQIYTVEERQNALENVKKYSWAKSMAKKAENSAEKYLNNYERIYNHLAVEGVPRFYYAGQRYDPNNVMCRYCEKDLTNTYGKYGFSADFVQREWKIQCPECKRIFPSNDFGKFYELGLSDDRTLWHYGDALQKHHELFVCEHVKAGRECAHESLYEKVLPQLEELHKQTCTYIKKGQECIHPAREAGCAEWYDNDPRDEEWKKFYGYDVEGGYLTNDLYKEMDAKFGKGWAVDDGFGYRQPYIADKDAVGYDSRYTNKDGYARYNDGTYEGPVVYYYIALAANNGVWQNKGSMSSGSAKYAMNLLKEAFLYTGDPKYGRAGAIILDRIADIYPEFSWFRWHEFRDDFYRGTIADTIETTYTATWFVEAYDAFLPMYNDPYVIQFLSEHGARYKADEKGNYIRNEDGSLIPVNLKNTPGLIRKNAEDSIVRKTFDDLQWGRAIGNFGLHQDTAATVAIALNSEPETGEVLDWLFRYGNGKLVKTNPETEPILGAGTDNVFVQDVDRDGQGNENSVQYNQFWLTYNLNYADKMAQYVKQSGKAEYEKYNLFNNPKFVKLFTSIPRLTLGGYYSPQMGDSSGTASTDVWMDKDTYILGYKYTKLPLLAQVVYMLNGDSTDGLYTSIFDKNPERIAEEIETVIDEYGTFALESDMLTGFGFAVLRAGADYQSANSQTAKNNIRDIGMYFGSGNGHGHADMLTLYMDAFGLNIAPDLGYPEQTGEDPNRKQWVRTTLSHNTVLVDETEHPYELDAVGTPYHFDDNGRVKVMDVNADVVYDQCDEYRRSVVMVEVDDDISYGVDFFHIKGGDDHLYSFHSQSDEISAISGLEGLYEQSTYVDEAGNTVGTYAGADVAYGPDPGGNNNPVYPRGYTWLKNIRTYNSIDKDFSIEFKVKDWNKVMDEKRDVRLRLTMVNDEPLDEVTFATGLPPAKDTNKNIGSLEYLLVRNKGNNLDTTFTTILEPYDAANKYIETIEKVSMVRKTGEKPGLNDAFSAVKVTLKNGRVDYVIYSNNNSVEYVVDNKIEFSGFAGVISLDGESVVYSYLNDGNVLKLLDKEQEVAPALAYTGTVKSFTDSMQLENKVVYIPTTGESVDPEVLAGKYVYIDNDDVQNGVYKIESAEEISNGDIELDLGDVTLIRKYVDPLDTSLGYEYNISEGQTLRIPFSSTYDASPRFTQPMDYTVSAGSSINIPLKVESVSGKEITLVGTTLPRGMSINQQTQTLTWKPDDSQGGENHVAITASDGILETTVHFTVTVYGRTTGKPSEDTTEKTETPSTGNNGGSGGGGGGGGGAAPTDKPEDTTDADNETDNASDSTKADAGNGAYDVSNFTDLTNHAWATDAINELAASGIIRGTSETTFAPASNITRADFAILLVRAFGLTSDNTENFADVSASDYFASELAIARNAGIVGGIGENKFAPRNNITRQDMMVIVYRALASNPVGEGLRALPPTEESQYTDFAAVADYAKEAVCALIGAGLINGKNNLIAPADYTTRAEVAVLIKRILDYTK